MKNNKTSVSLKQVISSMVTSSIAKAKSIAVKSKMNAAKARLIMLTLMKSKKAVLLDEDKYPDLTHCLFDEEMELEAETQGGSIIEMVRNSKEEGEDFRLEDEIDHVADLFITRFYKQMRLQKLLSFKRYQEMMERSV
ncbi:hypothetical protein V6Z12_A09G003000 [Gossypium hirsutum]